MQFRDVKMPTYDKGYLIIHSDHAYTSTFKTWLPLIQKYDRMHNQWIDSKAVNFGVAVNTAPVGSSGYLTPVELKKCMMLVLKYLVTTDTISQSEHCR